jgi:hypothetical protein
MLIHTGRPLSLRKRNQGIYGELDMKLGLGEKKFSKNVGGENPHCERTLKNWKLSK